MNLIKNYGFGAGKHFYKKLPELLILLYNNRNWKIVKKNLESIINMHFRALNEGK